MGAIWGRSLEEQLGMRGLQLARDLDLARHYNPLALQRSIRVLRSFTSRNNIDIIHSHLLHDHWLAAMANRGVASPPRLVRTVHRYEQMRKDPLHRWLFEKQTDAVITVSTEQQEIIMASYPALAGRVEFITGGVDPEKFRPDTEGGMMIRNDMGERPEAPVAGIVAHLGFKRGHNWLLEAAPRVIDAVPNCSIWIVGQGELKHELRERVHEPQFRGRVAMAGYRTHDLPQTYAAMDVALLLALGSEGSGRAALEAMACGKPVIGVRKGALIDTITDGVDGFLVEENDVAALAAALTRLLSDRELARQMGAAARDKIVAHFTEQHRAKKTLELYERLASA